MTNAQSDSFPVPPAPTLRAPEGTNPTTPWTWAFTVIPLVTLAVNIPFAMSGADRLRLTGGSVGYPAGHYEELLLLFVVHVVEIIVAYNDSRRLKQRGVPYPFGWGWTFLGGLVYAIGRAVIVRRRTGSGLLPLWIYLAIFVVADVTEFSVSFGNVSG